MADIKATTIIDMKHTTPTKIMPPMAMIEPVMKTIYIIEIIKINIIDMKITLSMTPTAKSGPVIKQNLLFNAITT